MRELITQRKNLSEVNFAAQDIVDGFIDETLKGDWPFKSDTDIPFVRKFYIQDEIITKATPRQKLDAGQVVHYISTAALDRDHEIMKPSGVELKHYRKNPLVLWSHDPTDPDNIVGKNVWVNQDQKGLVSLTQFALSNEKAAKVYNLYRDGFLRAWSVGFTPLKGKKPKPDEKLTFIMGDTPKPGEVMYVHEKWALLEYSAVGVPSNPEALTEQVAKGYELTDELVKELEINLEGYEIGKKDKTIIDLGGILGDGESKEKGKESKEEEGGEEGKEKGGDGLKGMDLEGNPSAWDIASALRAVFRKKETKDKYIYVADLYPVNYPDGHCVAEINTAGKPNKYFLYDYTYNEGEIEIENPRELDLGYTARSWTEILQRADTTIMTTELYEGIAENIEGMKSELMELKAGREISAKNMKMLSEVAEKMEEATTAVRALLDANKPEEGKHDDSKTINVEALMKDVKVDKEDEAVLTKEDQLKVLEDISMDDLAKEVMEKRKGKVS